MIGHQLCMGSFLSLADLWPTPCRAVVVGVNPAPHSVEIGHYYQGANGARQMGRLREAGLLPPPGGGFVDDEAVAVGVGFTDVVKRPTARATDLSRAELATGRKVLREALAERGVPLVVCVFKPAAVALLGSVDAPGLQRDSFGTSRVFLMPGPYLRSVEVRVVMAQLAAHLRW